MVNGAQTTGDVTEQKTESIISDANLFVSYRKDDDNHLAGAMIAFMKQIAEHYKFLYGRDLSLFIDRESIKWGENWHDVLKNALETTNFLVPQLSTGYLQSPICRWEVEQFEANPEGRESNNILPLLWTNLDELELSRTEESLRDRMKELQWIDLTGIRFSDSRDRNYMEAVENVTMRLREVIIARKKSPAPTSKQEVIDFAKKLEESDSDSMPREDSEHDFLVEVSLFQQRSSKLQMTSQAVSKGLDDIGVEMQKEQPSENMTPADLNTWFSSIAKRTAPIVKRLDDSLDQLDEVWQEIRPTLDMNYDFQMIVKPNSITDFENDLTNMRDAIIPNNELRDSVAQIKAMQVLSPRLRPLAKVFDRFLTISDAIAQDIDNILQSKHKRYDSHQVSN